MATAARLAQKARVYESPEAQSLVERMQTGDETAFNLLYTAHHSRVLTAIEKYIDERDIAEHIANGVFAKVWEVRNKAAGFKGGSAFSTWITRIAINEALMHLRRTKRERNHVTRLDERMSGGDGREENDAPERPELGMRDLNLEGIVDRKTLAVAISYLPDDYRTVFILRLVDGLTTEETCQALGLEITVVKSRLFRARNMVKARLTKKKAVHI
jgi:RNA polymerase sigma-70 factor (ECF subfamily)